MIQLRPLHSSSSGQCEAGHPERGAAQQQGSGFGPAGREGEGTPGSRCRSAAEEGAASPVPSPVVAQEEAEGTGGSG